MKRAERLARHYIRAADLRAVYLAATKDRVRIAMTREPVARARELKRSKARLVCLYWLGSSAAATRLIHAACEAFPGIDKGAAGNPATVKAALVDLARAARVTLTDDATVQARAAAVARDIEDRVKAMQTAGQLRGLNAKYRSAREDAAKRGVSIMSYGDYLERYKIKMLYEIAAAARDRP